MHHFRKDTINAHKLEINIPNFSHSEEKDYKETIRVVKSKSTTQPFKKKLNKDQLYPTNLTPSHKGSNYTRLMKIKW